jgi:hypothetical protein
VRTLIVANAIEASPKGQLALNVPSSARVATGAARARGGIARRRNETPVAASRFVGTDFSLGLACALYNRRPNWIYPTFLLSSPRLRYVPGILKAHLPRLFNVSFLRG